MCASLSVCVSLSVSVSVFRSQSVSFGVCHNFLASVSVLSFFSHRHLLSFGAIDIAVVQCLLMSITSNLHQRLSLCVFSELDTSKLLGSVYHNQCFLRAAGTLSHLLAAAVPRGN